MAKATREARISFREEVLPPRDPSHGTPEAMVRRLLDFELPSRRRWARSCSALAAVAAARRLEGNASPVRIYFKPNRLISARLGPLSPKREACCLNSGCTLPHDNMPCIR